MYLALKALHVLAVIFFLGNVLTGFFWKRHADASGDLAVRAATLAGLIRADRMFTLPAVALIVATGMGAALLAHLPILGTPWIAASLALFGLAGAVFSLFVGPLQTKLLACVQAGIAGQWDAREYESLSSRWRAWGWVATGAPLIVVILMVFKPTF